MIKEVSSVLLLGGLLSSSVVGQGPSVVGHGPSVVGQGPSVVGQGPSVVGQGPSVVGQGPSVVGQGPSVVGQGPSVVGQVPSVVGQGPYYVHRPTNGSPVGNYYPLAGYQAGTPISYTQMDVNAAAIQLIQVLAAQQTQLKHQNDQSAILKTGFKDMLIVERRPIQGGSMSEIAVVESIRARGCGLLHYVGCSAQITVTVLACIPEIVTGAGLAACVAEVIGAGNSCYGCICAVIRTFGFHCPSVDGVHILKNDQSAMMMVERRPIQVESMSEMAVVRSILASGCSILKGIECTAGIGGVVGSCILLGLTGVGVAACVAESIGIENTCHGCICTVMDFFGVSC